MGLYNQSIEEVFKRQIGEIKVMLGDVCLPFLFVPDDDFVHDYCIYVYLWACNNVYTEKVGAV